MKVNQGAFSPLRGTLQPKPAAVPAAPAPAPAASAPPLAGVPALDSLAVPRRSRLPKRMLLSLGVSAVVLGCAAVDPAPWRVEPTYRVQDSGPGTARAYLALARQHEGEFRSTQAIAAYRKAAQAAPDDADVHNLLGVALAREAQYGAAVLSLRRAVALAPDRAQLLNNLGYALMLDGRMDEARAIIRLTLALDSRHVQANRNLAYAEERLAATPVAAPAASVAPAVVAAPELPQAAPAPAPAPVPVPAVAAAIPTSRVAPSTAMEAAAAAPPPPMPEPSAPKAAQTAAGGVPVVMAAAPPPVAAPASLQGVSVEIVNGNGIAGNASRLRGWLRERGVAVGRLANLLPYNSAQTQVLYRPGKVEQARSMALRLPVVAHVQAAPVGSIQADLRVLIGHDVIYSAGCTALAVCATPERLTAEAARPQ